VVAQEDGAAAGPELGSSCGLWLHPHALAGLTSMQVRCLLGCWRHAQRQQLDMVQQ
jgi:hypothetical protein